MATNILTDPHTWTVLAAFTNAVVCVYSIWKRNGWATFGSGITLAGLTIILIH